MRVVLLLSSPRSASAHSPFIMCGTHTERCRPALKKTFGDLFYLNIAGQSILVINSGKVAYELLDRRSANYSERPRLIVAGEILSGGLGFGLNSYNAATRKMRTAVHGALNNHTARQYHPMQMTEAVLLTQSLLEKPEAWKAHIRRSAASLIMTILYDHPPVLSESNSHIQHINNHMERLSLACRPGAHLVELFPWMLYIPQSFAKWKREAYRWFEHDSQVFEGLVNEVAKRMTGNVRPCFTTALIENADEYNLSELEIAWVAGTMFGAGSETTASVMEWFLLAMIAFPDVQKRAQEELDSVVGHSRVPTFADFEHLPYIQAIVRESLRWRTTVPLGLPHRSLQDDWYKDMFIPKGTICIANVQYMNRDPEVFGPDPADFNPGRYLDENGGIKPNSVEDHWSLGFGRRNCLGRFVGSNSLFIDIAILLWAAKISRAKDDVGPLDLDGFVDDGMVIHPVPFRCEIKPRFSDVSQILSQEKEHLMH
ncbi:cytochrome P450 [Dentipellis sp. KUC8613]|nr:cytochrome P450 [Dentipellis sp. KUC8613]